AMSGDPVQPDKRGYNFYGCSPNQLAEATVKDGRIVFPGGAGYRVLVLPLVETMTSDLIAKITELAEDGALIIGELPNESPSLADHLKSASAGERRDAAKLHTSNELRK